MRINKKKKNKKTSKADRQPKNIQKVCRVRRKIKSKKKITNKIRTKTLSQCKKITSFHIKSLSK